MAAQESKREYVIPKGFHRNRDIPELYTIAEKPLYKAVELFLIKVDDITPQVRGDLAKLRSLWTFNIEEILNSTLDTWMPQYTFLRKQVSDSESQALANAILEWAKKHNLVDRNQSKLRFIEVGIQWLCLDSQLSEEDRLNGYELGLADAIELDSTLGSDLLKERNGQNGYLEDYRARNIPFVFSPSNARLGIATYTKGKMLADLSGQPAPYNVVKEMSQIVDYDNLRARLLGNLDSDETKSRAHGLSVPYRYGRVYNPEEENWGDFEAEMLHNFRVYLEAYKQIILGTASYDELQEKREPDHFDWLVRFQIDGWKQEEIASYYSVAHAPTISKALKSTAHVVGLELRRQKRGPDRIQGMRRSLTAHHK